MEGCDTIDKYIFVLLLVIILSILIIVLAFIIIFKKSISSYIESSGQAKKIKAKQEIKALNNNSEQTKATAPPHSTKVSDAVAFLFKMLPAAINLITAIIKAFFTKQ